VIENALCLAREIARGSAQKCEVAAQLSELGAYNATDFWRESGEGHRLLRAVAAVGVGLFMSVVMFVEQGMKTRYRLVTNGVSADSLLLFVLLAGVFRSQVV
jgi:hypothetical protein